MYKDLIETAKRIIAIARARENDKSYNNSDFAGDPDPYHLLFMKELDNLEIDSILALQAIMYLGRDRDYDESLSPDLIFASAFDELKASAVNDKEVEIIQLEDSMRDGRYLRDGYQILGISI